MGGAGQALQAVGHVGGVGAKNVRNGGDLNQQRNRSAGLVGMASSPNAGEAGFVDIAAARGIELHRYLAMPEATFEISDARGRQWQAAQVNGRGFTPLDQATEHAGDFHQQRIHQAGVRK